MSGNLKSFAYSFALLLPLKGGLPKRRTLLQPKIVGLISLSQVSRLLWIPISVRMYVRSLYEGVVRELTRLYCLSAIQ